MEKLTGFLEQIKRTKAEKRALLLDYDGTLAPFREERDQAVPYPGVREILTEIIAQERCRVAVISGRSVEHLAPLLSLSDWPEVWGSHGWERRFPDGKHADGVAGEIQRDGLDQAESWAEEKGLADRLEVKPYSVAFHWRGLSPQAKKALQDEVSSFCLPLARACVLEIHEFDGGVELRIPGRDKGFAVTTILQEIGQGAVGAYLGDDLTDEDAFAALKGRGLGVLVRKEHRPTAADLWIRPPEELLEFLVRWGKACA